MDIQTIIQDIESPFVALFNAAKVEFAKDEAAFVSLFNADKATIIGNAEAVVVDAATLFTIGAPIATGYLRTEALKGILGEEEIGSVITNTIQDLEKDPVIMAKGKILVGDVQTLVHGLKTSFQNLSAAVTGAIGSAAGAV